MSPAILTPKQRRLLEWIEAYVNEKGYMPSRREMAEGMGVSSVATIQQHVEAIEAKGFLKLREGEFRGVSLSKRWEHEQEKRRQFQKKMQIQEQVPESVSGFRGQTFKKDSHGSLSQLPSSRISEKLSEKTPEIALDVSVPLLGRIAAGYPIEVFSSADVVEVPRTMISSGTGTRSRAQKIPEFYALRVQGDSMIGEGILDGDLVVCERRRTANSGETVVALWKGEATLKRFQKTREGVELHPANPQYPVMRIQEEDAFEIQGVLTGVVRTYGRRFA